MSAVEQWEATQVSCDRCKRVQAFEAVPFTYQWPEGWHYIGVNFHRQEIETEHLIVCDGCLTEDDEDDRHVLITLREPTAPAARNARWLEVAS